jgi:hypothetical protein
MVLEQRIYHTAAVGVCWVDWAVVKMTKAEQSLEVARHEDVE